MGLDINGLVSSGINLAMDLTPDVQKTLTYRRRKGSSLNTTTGEITPVETLATAIAAIVTTYNEADEPAGIQMGDEKVVIRFSDLIAKSVTDVDTDDVLDEADGTRRKVITFSLDPTRQVLSLQTRRIGS
jgi:hypothetical protein